MIIKIVMPINSKYQMNPVLWKMHLQELPFPYISGPSNMIQAIEIIYLTPQIWNV